MRIARRLRLVGTASLVAAGLAWVLVVNHVALSAADNTGVISGTVTSANGPEAGVWVIAETDGTPTKLRKIVVTNDEGKYLLPELPKATFQVWVRGYGLTDSKPVLARPDQTLDLKAVVAKTPQDAAQVYPANYWASMLQIPEPSEFPGTGPTGNGINPAMTSQADWVANYKECARCHQVGDPYTRIVPDLEKFDSTIAAWDDRVQRGQRGVQMSGFVSRYGRQRGLKFHADWSDAIKAGAVPVEKPVRPTGIERNVVLTIWQWADAVAFMHDAMSTSRWHPTVNAYGKIYGTDIGNDHLTVLDPQTHTASMLKVPMLVEPSSVPAMVTRNNFKPYRFFGTRPVWEDPAQPHNPMMDKTGRVWITSAVRGADNPAWCKEGSDNKYAKYFPNNRSGRQLSYYDPKGDKFTLIDVCFGTHHLQFNPEETRLYVSGSGPVVGWFDTKVFDQTNDAKRAQGWCPAVVDTNGDGKITKPWNEPGAATAGTEGEGGGARIGTINPKLDTRVIPGAYGVIVNPVDGSLWMSPDENPGRILRFVPGNNPPETCLTEVYNVPGGLGRPRGIDVDSKGIIWTAFAASSDFVSFDRSKCKVFNGPTATGDQCQEGWTLYPIPGPTFQDTNFRTDFHYYNWVDQFNTLGLGHDIPIATGSSSDSLIVLKPGTAEFIRLTVPYPMGFHARGVDGRIDDANAGWKGRGIYATYGQDAAWHIEGGPIETSNLVKFQIRPDALAR